MFPCNNCLVKACCSSYCNNLIEDERVIAMYLLTYSTCPDCGNYAVEKSPDDMVMLCKACRKVFTQQIQSEIPDDHISISSSSPSVGSSTSIQSKPFTISVAYKNDLPYGKIITDISKYHKVKMPKRQKLPKVEYITDSPKETSNYKKLVVFRRMTPRYSETLIKNMDTLTKSRLAIPEAGERPKENELSPEWIFKYSDLFLNDPNANEPQEDSEVGLWI